MILLWDIEDEISTILENRKEVIGIGKPISVEHIILNGCTLNVTSCYVKPVNPKTIG
ncbi:MAG: hypothetical protein QMC13_09635 [Colwellia sp.]